MTNEKQVLRHLQGALEQIRDYRQDVRVTTSSYCKQYMRVMFPYSLQRDLNGEENFIVNREYKPLGLAGSEKYVEYREYPCKLSKIVADEIDIILGQKKIFFHDGNPPWSSQKNYKAYELKLLAIIAMLEKNV
jgi:hypothetical protein